MSCRAVVEASLFEFVRRKGLISSRHAVVDNVEYRPAEIRRLAQPFIGKSTFRAACGEGGVIKTADRLLHSKRGPVEVTEAETLAAVKATFAPVEHLFG